MAKEASATAILAPTATTRMTTEMTTATPTGVEATVAKSQQVVQDQAIREIHLR